MSPHTFDDYQKLKAEIKKEVMSEVMSEQKPQLKAIMHNQDDMRKDMFTTNQKIDTFIEEIKPVLQWFQDYNSFRKVGGGWLKMFALIGAALTGLGLFISYILKLGK